MRPQPFSLFLLGQWGDSAEDAALIYRDDKPFMDALDDAGLVNYSYGCARIAQGPFKKVSVQMILSIGGCGQFIVEI